MANEFKIKKGLIVTGADGGTVVDVQGSQGQLFSVTDNLSGSIFAVSDISGVPILDVNSSGVVNIDGNLIGSSTAYFSGAITTNLSSEGTYFTGGSGSIRQLSITSGTNISAHALHTFNIASSNGKYEFDVNGTTELSLDSSNATFAGDIIGGGSITIGGSGGYNAGVIYSDTNWGMIFRALQADPNVADFMFANSEDVERLRITSTGATFADNIYAQKGVFSDGMTVTGNISTFETTLTDNEDWINSPISILERGNVGSNQSADKYAPNLNFHWSGRSSKSLWLGATGNLNFGEYSATGIPASDGRINAATFYGDHLGTINTATTGTTQTAGDDSTKIATTAYADAAAAAVDPSGVYLPLTAGSGSPLTGDLYIEGADKALRINNGAQPVVYLGDGGANTDGQLILYNSSGNANIVLNGDNQNHYITNGNVGIGTTNPQQKLRVASPSSTSVVLGASYLSTNNNNFFEVGILANDGYLNLRNSGVQTTVHIDSDGNSFLNGGNVGIGATSPSAKLHIDGDLIITDTPQGQGDFLTVNPVSGKVTSVSSRDVSFGEAYINNYRSRVLDYGGTYFPTGAAGNVAKHKSNNLFNLMSMMLLPGGVFSGKVTAAKPKTGVDFTWTRTTVANYTNEEGVITEAPIATPRIDYANNSNGEILIEPTRTNLVPNSGPGNYGNGPGSSSTVPGPNGVYDSAIVPVPDSNADRYQYSIAANTHSDGDVFTYSWYRRRLSTPVQDVFVGDLNIDGLINCTLTGATTQIESNISGFDRFACQITITLGNTEALVRGYFGALIGIGNSSIAYFGQQLELGDFATTLINTTGSAITRDNDYMIVNNLSDTIFEGMVGQGGMYMDFDYKREGGADGLRFYDENNITPRVYLYQGITGISDSWNAGNFPLNQTSGNKIGYMFTSTTSAVYCANGANVVTSSPTAAQALDTPLDTLFIDGNQNLLRIRELSMFTQMTSAQLVTLTTL